MVLEGVRSHVKECFEIAAEARDSPACWQEREDIIRAIGAAVQIPSMPSE